MGKSTISMAIFHRKLLVSEVGIRRLNEISEHQDRTQSPKQASSSGENMLADGGNLGKPIGKWRF